MANTFSFYGGRAVLKKRMYGTRPSFKREGETETLISVTGCTTKLDKSKVLLPWAVALVATHITTYLESSQSGQFGRDELVLVVTEAQQAPDRAKVSGGDTGTLIHDFAEAFAKAKIEGTELPTLDHLDESIEEQRKAINGIAAFLDWYNDNDVEFLEMEKLVYYNSLLAGDTQEGEPIIEYYGFLDLVARVNGKVAVVDYKSSKGIYNDQRYQVAGYRVAYDSDEPANKSDCGMIVNFNKLTGELIPPAVYDDEETRKDFTAFLGLRMAALREKQLDKEWKASRAAEPAIAAPQS